MEDAQYGDLLELILPLSSKGFLLGFDRNLWSILSSGCVPPQLYKLSAALDNPLLFIAGDDNLCNTLEDKDFFSHIELVTIETRPQARGSLKAVDFVEEEFFGGRYSAHLHGRELVDKLHRGAISLYFSTSSHAHELLLVEDMACIDDYMFAQEKNGLSAEIFYLPAKQKIKELPELLKDSEKIHLDPKLRGIHC